MNSTDKKDSTNIKKQIQKLILLSSENQQLKDYLNHLQNVNSQINKHVNKIESSSINIYMQKILFFIKKPYAWYSNIKLQSELNSKTENKKSNSFDVINFAVIPYNFRFQRPQQLAKELVKKGHRVFYIENDFIFYSDKNDELIPEIKKIEHNLYSVKLATHNKFTKRKFVYYGEISNEDKKELVESLNVLRSKARISNCIFKIDNPPWTLIIEKGNIPILYDCLDDHEAFEVKANDVESKEMDLVKKSDAIIACSAGLVKKMKSKTSQEVTLIGNACEYEHFTNKGNYKIPKELEKMQRPIIGYCGAISQRFDEKMLEDIVKEFPNYSFVLIGRLDKPEVAELAKKYRNIFLLGEKDYRLISTYYQSFDVCFSPYVVDKAAKNLDPVKIYEYLATGKPTVISNISGLYHLNKLIYISKDSRDFCKNIKSALIEKNSKLSIERQQYAKNNTWEIRANQLESVINKTLKENYDNNL